MRDRLIEIVKESLVKNIDYTHRLAESITDDLLANGVIVPPLWAGQTVYYYNHYLGGVFAYLIDNVGVGYLGKSGIYWTFEAACHDEETDELLDCLDFDLDYIGKTVFLTREEAEKALAERSER